MLVLDSWIVNLIMQNGDGWKHDEGTLRMADDWLRLRPCKW
jgi:hypothetical protein